MRRRFDSWDKGRLAKALKRRGWKFYRPEPGPQFARCGAQHRSWAKGSKWLSLRNAGIAAHLVIR